MELRNHECVICFLMLIFGSKCCKLIRWYHPAREIFNIASCYAELITEIKIEANTVALLMKSIVFGMCWTWSRFHSIWNVQSSTSDYFYHLSWEGWWTRFVVPILILVIRDWLYGEFLCMHWWWHFRYKLLLRPELFAVRLQHYKVAPFWVTETVFLHLGESLCMLVIVVD